MIFHHRNTTNSIFSKPLNPETERLISSPTSRDDLPSCAGPEGCSNGGPDGDIEDMIVNEGEGCSNRSGTRRYRCDSTHRDYCTGLIRRYEVPPAEDALSPNNVLMSNITISGIASIDEREDREEILRHRLLLVLLSISMFLGGALCVWTLLMEKMSGIYLELVFLDGLLNLGQSIFTMALFGISTKGVLLNIRRVMRRLVYGREQIILPAWEDLDEEDRNVSTRFINHHLEVCMEKILHDVNIGLRRHTAVCFGSELVTWLVERGLAQTRQEAVSQGRHLLRGRVIRHVDDHLDFYDGRFLYTFLPENRRA